MCYSINSIIKCECYFINFTESQNFYTILFYPQSQYSHVSKRNHTTTHSALVAAVKQMEDCLDEVKVWMARNYMFMNDSKTQNLPIVRKSADAIVDKSVIRVGVATIPASLCVQCLGVCIDRHLDRHLDTKKQVSQTISACSFYLRNINQISRFLPRPTKERVDYA